MLDKLKIYLVEVVLKKYGPSFIKGALGAVCLYISAHTGIMEAIGIGYDPSDNTITLEISKFSAWLLAGGTGVIMAAFTAIQHHAGAAVAGKPQSGDMRRAADVPLPGGDRKGDPQA